MNEAQLWNVLGISYSHSKRLANAIESYKKALKLDPNLAEAHLNLAYACEKVGRGHEAETEYQIACRLDAKFCKFVPAN